MYKNFRELNVRKYPFTIAYAFDENVRLVTVISFYHHKKNPKNKYLK
jgi:hypothetical protein